MKVLTEQHREQLATQHNVDPRAFSEEPLAPPFPLPHVSRKALKRVKSPLPTPEECRYCWSAVALVNHGEIYGREYGDWPYAYLCRSCGAYVGVHPNTDIPLGTLANEALRLARNTHKSDFIELQKAAFWSRHEAYQFLADALGIELVRCHWGWFEIDQCEQAGQVCREKLKELRHGRD